MSNIANIVEGYTALVSGKSKSDKRISIVENASVEARRALVGIGGKAGKLAAAQTAAEGFYLIADSCSKAQYRGAAEFFAGLLGKNIAISNRASYLALPDRMQELILEEKGKKNGGYTLCKKTGEQKMTSGLKLALTAHAMACDLIALAEEIFQERLIAKLESEKEAA